MPVVAVLTCPVCGAPIDAGDARCSYCGSVVVIHTDHPRLEPHRLNKAVIDEHIAKYRAALRQDSRDADAHFGLGVAYFNLGLLEEAAEELKHAARLMPESAQIQTQLGVVLADLAEHGKLRSDQAAWDRVERALLLQPDLSDALLLKARLETVRGDTEAAVETLRRAVAADRDAAAPKLVAALLDQSADQRAEGDWAESVESWREAASLDPDSVRRPIAAFLAAHQTLLGRGAGARAASRENGHAPRLGPQPARPWLRTTIWAVVTMLGFCVLATIFAGLAPEQNGQMVLGSVTGALFSVTCFGVIVAPASVAIYRWKFAAAHRASAGLNRQERARFREQLLAGTSERVDDLLDAAASVASALEDRVEAGRRSR